MQETSAHPTIHLRTATPHDEAFLRELYFHVRGEEVAAWGWDQATQQLFLQQQYAARQYGRVAYGSQLLVHIILEGLNPIGEFVILPLPNVIEIHDIAVMAAYRHRGIGSAVLRTILSQAADERKSVSLHVLPYNTAAIRLYQRLGFQVVENNGVYLTMISEVASF